MKITTVETFEVPPRWLFCRIATDEGIVGWGEPVIEGRARTVRAAVAEMSKMLVGRDPTRIEDTWQLLTRSGFYRGGPILSSAVAGIDQALWDITGQSLGVPVHQLLDGRVRDRLRMYSWIGGDEPSLIAEDVARQVECGMTAVKMNASGRWGPIETTAEIDGVLHRVEAARDVLGPDRDVAVDFHGRVSRANARRVLEVLGPVRPLFVEEPVLPELGHTLGDLRSGTSIPLATGERLFTRQEFLGVLTAGIDVVQPDISHAGGISEVHRIAALADTFGSWVAPHCPLGPIALAACIQVDLVIPNFLIQEQSLGIHYNQGNELLDYLVDPSVFTITDGYLAAPNGPGLGISVDEDAVRRAAEIGHDWHPPVWRHADGSLAEW